MFHRKNDEKQDKKQAEMVPWVRLRKIIGLMTFRPYFVKQNDSDVKNYICTSHENKMEQNPPCNMYLRVADDRCGSRQI